MAIQQLQEPQDDVFIDLIQVNFDPVQFLNESLPTLNLSQQSTTAKQPRSLILQSASADVQDFISKLSTHSIRSSTDLATLTDDILRSANRLAYEVEVLRGDVNSLYELLSDSLKKEISRFILEQDDHEVSLLVHNETRNEISATNTPVAAKEPEFIHQLRVLGTVKSRLEAVIQVFGEALGWPIPPSDVSMASTLISVSAPELGVISSAEDDQAREYTRKLRAQIVDTLEMDGGGRAGLAAAITRINDLRALSQVWKGTAEEKARNKVVESMAKIVEERKKLLESRAAGPRSSMDDFGRKSGSTPNRPGRTVEASTNPAVGLFRNLQKLRDELYQD